MKCEKIRVAAFGDNGHQIISQLADHPLATLVAVSAVREDRLAGLANAADIRRCDSFDDLLADPDVDLISLCSPRRRDQAPQAIAAMQAGKCVYAEKPCAMSESDLDAIIETSRRTGKLFHEMAGTAFDQPYLSMRQVVASGQIGEVVQVLVQKSYPLHDRRPGDEDIDGGLLMQVGVHAARMIEHVAGVRVAQARAIETMLGNGGRGRLRIAAGMQMTLENGGIASLICNYLNPPTFGRWGNEMLRIFGTGGFVESTDGGVRTRLVTSQKDFGPLNTDAPAIQYHDMFFDEILGRSPMPMNLDAELHPTRVVIRAKASTGSDL